MIRIMNISSDAVNALKKVFNDDWYEYLEEVEPGLYDCRLSVLFDIQTSLEAITIFPDPDTSMHKKYHEAVYDMGRDFFSQVVII